MVAAVSGTQVRLEELDAIIVRRMRAGALVADAVAERIAALLAEASVDNLANTVERFAPPHAAAADATAPVHDSVMAAKKLSLPDIAALVAARLTGDEVVAVRRVDPRTDHAGQRAVVPPPTADPERVIRALLRRIATEDLVGLALSGGGIRSASFNLGLLEALNADATPDKNLLRQVDYLSTVSGGGYIGSHLSSQLVQPGSTIDNLPLRSGPAGEPTSHVRRMIHGGKYLNRPLNLVNRYLIGLVYNNIVFVGAALGMTLLIAFLWRGLDWPPLHAFLSWLSRGELLDYNRPFLPGLVMLLAWFVCWAILYWAWICKDLPLRLRLLLEATIAATIFGIGVMVDRLVPWSAFWPFVLVLAVSVVVAALFWLRSWLTFALGGLVVAALVALVWMDNHFGEAFAETIASYLSPPMAVVTWLFVCACGHTQPLFGRVALWQRRFLLATVVGLLIGGAIWIGTPNINTVNTLASAKNELSYIKWDPGLITLIVAGVVLIGLLPFLRPRDLLRSGERPKTQVHLIVFRIASFALLGGLPFVLIYCFGRHDISGHAQRWDRDVVSSDLKDWELFWPKLFAANPDAAKTDAAKTDADPSRAVFARQVEALARERPVVGDLRNNETVRYLCRRTERFSAEREPVTFKEWRDIEATRDEAMAALNEAIKGPGVASAILKDGGIERVRKAAAALDRAEQDELAGLLEKWQFNGGALTPQGKTALSFLLFRTAFAEDTWPRRMVRRVVVIDADQQTRWQWLLILGLFVPLFALLVNANATSPHWFYRDELARAYIQPLVPASAAHPPADPADMPLPWFDIPLRELNTTAKGGPYHLLSASITKGAEADDTLDSRQFLFSQLYCGSEQTGYEKSTTYHQGEFDLPSAMAISGAALSPLRIRNPLVALLMTLFNLRLGQWVLCPGHAAQPRTPLLEWLRSGPTLFGLAADIVWNRDRDECRKFLFLSDGGHDENLGVEQLLTRRCRFIIASDAGQDEEHLFADLAKLYRRARLRGIRMTRLDNHGEPASLDGLMLDRASGLCQHSFMMIRLEYPDGATGLLLYLKPSLLGSEEIDLKFFKSQNANFPHDPTVHAMFDPDHVESYRQLGLMIGRRISEPLAKLVGGATPERVQALADLLAQSVARKSALPELPEAVSRVLAGLGRRRRRPGKLRGGYTIAADQANLTPPFDAAVKKDPPKSEPIPGP